MSASTVEPERLVESLVSLAMLRQTSRKQVKYLDSVEGDLARWGEGFFSLAEMLAAARPHLVFLLEQVAHDGIEGKSHTLEELRLRAARLVLSVEIPALASWLRSDSIASRGDPFVTPRWLSSAHEGIAVLYAALDESTRRLLQARARVASSRGSTGDAPSGVFTVTGESNHAEEDAFVPLRETVRLAWVTQFLSIGMNLSFQPVRICCERIFRVLTVALHHTVM